MPMFVEYSSASQATKACLQEGRASTLRVTSAAKVSEIAP